MTHFKKALYGLLACAMFAAVLAVGVQDASADTSSGSATLTGGTLSISNLSSSFSYSTTLDGTTKNLSSSFGVTVTDPTGSNAGWKLQAQIGVFTHTTVNTKTIPAANHTIQSVSRDSGSSTGTAPTNGITYPMAIPTSTASIYNAAVDSGMGISVLTFTTQLTVPANAYAGSYGTTLTVTIASGP